ncbi:MULTISPECIES: hypothetical protein [unclassified Caballeronia]|uniref:hypothetical protein n=1 Tax=unclassified Caballeronia TaxID=2646786 RepID=UPI00285728BB|nr:MULTISPECIES: hypothetical protein [unclassified Caballeronia]MDR5753931.1 hypothetical protein [Caballeronia sp. LZ024]MDR5840310.1 hypothetical protein [Caballeronia sp. LZ031]
MQPATRAPRPRAERPHLDSGGGVFFPFDGDRPERKPVWPYVLAVLGAALFVTVYFRHESPQPQQALQPEIESQRGYDSGAVVAPPVAAAPDAVAAASTAPQTAPAPGNAGGESIADSAAPEAAGTVTSTPTDTTPARPTAAVPAPKAETPPAKNAVTASETNILNGVRYSLKQGDLTDARERFERLRQSVQARPEGRQVAEELNRRERERDAALQRARYCEAGKDWSCMAQNAAHAKDLDSGNAQSQVMLSMATSQLRWARSTRPAPSRSAAPTPAGPVAAGQ